MKKLIPFILFAFVLGSCGQSTHQQEGIVVQKKDDVNNLTEILLIPNISEDEISNKNAEELEDIAKNSNGAYYHFPRGEYKNLKVGTKIIVYWDGSQSASSPPLRTADKIKEVSTQ
ncbi:DUF3221 domain-containing protein [Pontibacillus yanchengensis]|uniref:DUF3221 domain-containing protein n=1 Tax=Pontibacillus yanchengensis TaxID=462910 RepID=UPI00136F5F7B|nr:DUF3221 domain-containing protein [Pontibacillus yanchengensis]